MLQEQDQYYHERASEYDEWFFRQGCYDRGEENRQQWFCKVFEIFLFFSLLGG
jgi:hypothetical protein